MFQLGYNDWMTACLAESPEGDCALVEVDVGCPVEAWDVSEWIYPTTPPTPSTTFNQDLSCWDISNMDSPDELPNVDDNCELLGAEGSYSLDCVENGSCIECTDGVGCTAWECDADYVRNAANDACVVARGPCDENERVQDNACVACAADETNEAGDDASGVDTECDAAGGGGLTGIFVRPGWDSEGGQIYQFDGSSWNNTGLDGSTITNSRKMGRIGESVYFSSDTNIWAFDGTAVIDTGIPASYMDSTWHGCFPSNDLLYCARYNSDVAGNYEHYTFDGSVFEEHSVIAYEGGSDYHPLQNYNYCTTMAGKALFLSYSVADTSELYTFDGSGLTFVRTLELGSSERAYGGENCFGQQGEETYLDAQTDSGTYNRYLMDIEGNLSLVEADSISLRSSLYFGEVDGVQYYSGWNGSNTVYYSFVDGETTLLSDWIVADTFPDYEYDVYGSSSLIPHCHGMC
jgi:hypothetical protein